MHEYYVLKEYHQSFVVLTAVIFFTLIYAKLQTDNGTMSAPLPPVTVGDTMSNLPEICHGHKREEMANGREPMSHFL